MEDWDERMWRQEQERVHGLGFRFVHATPDASSYLEALPPGRKLNILVSAYRLLGRRGGPIWRHLHKAQRVFLDSGAISLLKLAAKETRDLPLVSLQERDASGRWRFVRHPNGFYDTDEQWEDEYAFWFGSQKPLQKWLDSQPRLEETAWRLSERGVRHGFAAMMDHPCEPPLLTAVGVTVDQAADVTIRNAVQWHNDVRLPHGWKKVYVVQGWELDDYARCLDAFEWIGILDEVRRGHAWLAAGSTCMRRPTQKNGPGLYDVYRFLHTYLGPDGGHMHALGIAKPEWVNHMREQGWIHSADSATASMMVGFNRGPYAVQGRRCAADLPAQFADTMVWLEDQVMAPAPCDSNGVPEQAAGPTDAAGGWVQGSLWPEDPPGAKGKRRARPHRRLSA